MAWQIFPLLLSLWIISASAHVFVSIDCGSSNIPYTDENSIAWVGDNDYIQNGVSQEVQTTNSISKVMNTLRVFTTRNKNCYSIKAEQNGRVLLRVSFYYGNYDQKSSPPSFDLQFDGNDWEMVKTLSDEVVSYEVIYVVKGENLSVCVAQTNPDQFPFISAIEVRSLDITMYNLVDDNYALFLRTRIAYGTTQTIRYVNDSYDRIWNPIITYGTGVLTVSSDASTIDNNAGDIPPKAVLLNAITVSDVTSSQEEIILSGLMIPSESPVYLNMYFSEVTQLDSSTQNRSFNVFMGDQPFSDLISPPYEDLMELSKSNVTFSSSPTVSLVATSDSTLPPIINALELFVISSNLTSGTNSNDLEGLASLQSDYPLLQEWSGDPCLPTPYSWDWINCSSDTIPRVTALHLSSFGLKGLLGNFSSMDSLEIIDLRNNSFIGLIPDFLGLFPNLKELNLANNNFSGPIPASLSNKNGLITLVVTGNPELCASGNSCNTKTNNTSTASTSSPGPAVRRQKKSSKLPVIVDVAILVFPLAVVIWCVCAIRYHRRKFAAAPTQVM